MEQRKFGKTDLSVPVIGMGTWKTFDVRGTQAEADRETIVQTAYEAGANFFDSSPMYGEAERVLGGAVQKLGLRDKVMIATKVWTDSDEQSERQFANAFGYFGGYVDFYQVHNLVALQKRLSQLEEFKAQGKIRSLGVTHWSHVALDDIGRIMESGRIDGIQIPYNAADRVIEREILPLAQRLQIGVVVMRPLGAGELVSKAPPASELARFAAWGVTTWAQILLKWVVSNPVVSVAIPATSQAERMRLNAVAGDPPLFDTDTRELVSELVQRYSR
jgi:aryl-alcohol dehydrogenase-like predicted oxidoreductase